MGKQSNPGAAAPHNMDAYLRMNFLYQASAQLSASANQNLARHYAGLTRNVAERAVLRLYDLRLKRTIAHFANFFLTPTVGPLK